MSSPRNKITYNAAGDAVAFDGPVAVDVYRAAMLASSLTLLQKGIQPTRGFTMRKALDMASAYTGETYKRTESEKARRDLRFVVDEMKRGIPSEVES